MKLPNSYGTVYKLSGNRRRPYRAVVTIGWEMKDGRAVQKRATLGYYAKKSDALAALAAFNKAPSDLIGITFEQVYNLWIDEHFKDKELTTKAQYTSAFKYCAELYDRKMIDLKAKDLESVIDACPKSSVKSKIRLLFNQMYKYALKHEIVQKNYATLIESGKGSHSATIVRAVFTDDEIKRLHDNLDPLNALILLGIYSGWRPSELQTIEFTDDGCMHGGMKTEAGKNRIVPVLPDLADVVALYAPFKNYLTYQRAFSARMEQYGMSHKPHDTRHTFATLCDTFGVRPEVTKQLMGHSTADITEVYTHRNIETLKIEIQKIKVCYL